MGKPSSIFDKNNPDWAPSQNLGHDYQKVTATSQERYNRTQERNEKRRRSGSAFAFLELSKPSTTEDQANTYIDESNCKACQTDITAEYFTETLENDERLEKENASLKEKLKLNSLCKESFEEDNEKVLFYTGLPNWMVLLCVFNFVKDLLQSSKGVLPPFQKFLMCIIRLRLNLPGRDLRYRFGGISESTVSGTFLHVIDAIYQRLKPLIIWPDRDVLRKTLPMDFRKH